MISPSVVYGNTTGNTITFTYTAGDLTWTSSPAYGILRIKIPAGWSPPSLTYSDPGYFSVTVIGGVLYGREVQGQDLLIKVRNLQAGTGQIIVTYGDMANGPGAYVTGGGLVTLPVEAGENGAPTVEIADSPVINIIAATPTMSPTTTPVVGEGGMIVSPTQVVSGSCGVTLTFVYTAGATTWSGLPGQGTLRISLPAGWSPPSMNTADPGYFFVTTSGASWVGQAFDGQDMIIEARDLPALTGKITVYYGFKGAGGPGACVTGTGIVTLTTTTDPDGADMLEIGISPQIELIPPTPTITMTSTITDTWTVSPTITETWTITETHTITQTPTITETHTITPTNSVTPTCTVTPTYTVTPTPFWKVVGFKGFSDGMAEEVSLYVYPGAPYVCYRDTAYTDKATLMKYSGAWVPVGSKGFTEGIAYEPSLFVYTGIPYVAFRDYNGNTNKASLMKYVSPAWSYVGGRGFTPGAAYGPSLFVYATESFVAFRDAANFDKASVMKNNIAGWDFLGAPGLSSGTASSASTYIDITTGNKYVAYRDWANGYKVTVMKYNVNKWEAVGTPGISAGGAEYISLFVPAGQNPYVAYMDVANGNRATVLSFNGSTWAPVGSPGFSAGRAEYLTLSVYNGTPSVAFRDGGNDDRAVVMKYTAGSWSLFAIVSDAAANYVRLFIDQSAGKPYVAFRDENQGGKVTVMTYEGAY